MLSQLPDEHAYASNSLRFFLCVILLNRAKNLLQYHTWKLIVAPINNWLNEFRHILGELLPVLNQADNLIHGIVALVLRIVNKGGEIASEETQRLLDNSEYTILEILVFLGFRLVLKDLKAHIN